MKLMKINEFDLIQNAKTIYASLNKTSCFKFTDYVSEAARIYFNYKRSGHTPSQFNEKTKIPKGTIIQLNAMKKPNGNHWAELQLKIAEIDNYINQNVKELNSCISLLQNCPIINGYRDYSDNVLDILCPVIPQNNPMDFLNIIGFDIGQYNKCSTRIKTNKIVQKDLRKAQKIKASKYNFANDPVVLGIRQLPILNAVEGEKPPKIGLNIILDIISEYRKLLAREPSYNFKQFCNDCNLQDRYKSLNYYYHNFDKIVEKHLYGKNKFIKVDNRDQKIKELETKIEELTKDFQVKVEEHSACNILIDKLKIEKNDLQKEILNWQVKHDRLKSILNDIRSHIIGNFHLLY